MSIVCNTRVRGGMLGTTMTDSLIVALDDVQWLRRLAALLARDADDADDLVQETLVAAWSSAPRDVGRPARPWLATVLRNRFRMQRRAGKTRSRTAIVGATELPREVVDCILTASQRWIFPATMRGETREYQFVLPIAGRKPW